MVFAKAEDWKNFSMERIEGVIIYRKSTIVPFRRIVELRAFVIGERLGREQRTPVLRSFHDTIRPSLLFYGFDGFLPSRRAGRAKWKHFSAE